MKIEYLRDHDDWIPTIAGWFYEEWAKFHPELGVKGMAERLNERCYTDRLPLALVAVQGKQVIGTVSLKKHDMDTRMQYSPWIASLYVRKDYRNKRVGIRLIDAGLEKARDLGMKHIYLYTRVQKHVDFYTKLGWSVVETTEYRGGGVTVLHIMLD